MTVVGFAGMTHLGLVSATAVASKGFRTICFDGDANLIGALNSGRLPVIEPGLDDLLKHNGERQIFTADVETLGECDVVYVAPDIPTDAEGRSDPGVVRELIEIVTPALNRNAVMVVLSQVEPGFTRSLSYPDTARRYYQVETLVFGRAVERASHPERFIVGCAEPNRELNTHYCRVLEAFDCPILPMRYESAELAKISINFCLVASISVANTLSEVCERIGADWSEIEPALKLDQRIGEHAYLRPGLGIAGGNLERDLMTIEQIGGWFGTDTGIIAAWKHNSRYRRDWAVRLIKRELLDHNPFATVAVWGLAYKENTRSIKNSASLATIAQMQKARVFVHDPVVDSAVVTHPNCLRKDNPLAALEGADGLAILTPWPQYKKIDVDEIARRLSGRLVLDPYRVLSAAEAVGAGLSYHTLGLPSEAEAEDLGVRVC